MRASLPYRLFIHLAALATSVVILAPFAWLLYSSIVGQTDLVSRPMRWLPEHVTLDRYREIFAGGGTSAGAAFRGAMVNSFLVAGGTVVISLTVGVLGGYALARLRFPLRRVTLLSFLVTYMLPPIALIIPLYLLMSRFGLLDTRTGLIIVYCSLATPFALWNMSTFFGSLPVELEEAARVDGCSRLGALVRVMLPLSKPGILATALYAFLLCWDEFLYSLIFTSTSQAKTVPVAIAEFTGRNAVDFGLIAAGGVLAALPPVALAVMFQRYLITGLASGAVKG
ncbi:carbohydrate ABC transporter permease [Micromonospora sp. 4G57]|uniref:Carbohydrate ABC transporter permease n=1 Tax=Micromonospora sicca TaxID=2202420 RepID=A0ABU5JBL6_9ACTN|nr:MULTISPECIES: carbohydrate ABC transporter permease [unclassified Micromonospora]MDZ5441591.1 carbohydrate ABC transporter permease [Micromonospora sp. 4G57]MDZ5489988.1 carbohydrate ABC transporter permease [Micromonospora sp. 4G53]